MSKLVALQHDANEILKGIVAWQKDGTAQFGCAINWALVSRGWDFNMLEVTTEW